MVSHNVSLGTNLVTPPMDLDKPMKLDVVVRNAMAIPFYKVPSSINGRSVTKRKSRLCMTWSRGDLQTACQGMWRPRRDAFPHRMRKKEYAVAYIFLRGLLRLETLVRMRLIKSHSCPICKEKLQHPVFRYRESGYHLQCIRDYMLVSHTFRDPITNTPFTDYHLMYCDFMASKHRWHYVQNDSTDAASSLSPPPWEWKMIEYARDDKSLLILKNDPRRILDDRIAYEQEAQIDIAINEVDDFVDLLAAFYTHNATGISISCTRQRLETAFHDLVRLSRETADRVIDEYIVTFDDLETEISDDLHTIQLMFPRWQNEPRVIVAGTVISRGGDDAAFSIMTMLHHGGFLGFPFQRMI